MRRIHKLLTMMSSGGGGVTYLLRDLFTTDAAAPLTSPRTCEPGPGQLVVDADASNKLSVASGELVSATAGTRIWRFTQPGGAGFARAAGLCLAYQFRYASGTPGVNAWGWNSANPQTDTSMEQGLLGTNTTYFNARQGAGTVGALYVMAAGTHQLFFILDAIGGKIVANGKLIWVSVYGSSATLFPAWYMPAAPVAYFDNVRVTQLGAPWNTQRGIATSYVAVPGVNETITHEANALIEYTWTGATGDSFEFDVRMTDADNRWIIRGDQAGSTIKLIERNAGVETERSSAAQTWTNGTDYRIVVMCIGTRICAIVNNTTKNDYATATFNQTATQARVNKAGKTFTAWPYDLSGIALSALTGI